MVDRVEGFGEVDGDCFVLMSSHLLRMFFQKSG